MNTIITNEELNNMYLDYVNNYLTINEFAKAYNISIQDADELIKQSRLKHFLQSDINTLEELTNKDNNEQELKEELKRFISYWNTHITQL